MKRWQVAALGGAVFAYACWVSLAFGKSADQANLLLAGIDLLHGNWRLHGWFMVADNYWTSDVALGAVLSGLRWLAGRPEISPVTLVVQPALSWAVVFVVALLAARQMLSGKDGWWAATVLLAVCFVPAMRPDGPLQLAFLSSIHILTLLYVLVAFLLGQAMLAGTRWRSALAGSALMLMLAELGDPFALVIGGLPLVLAIPFAHASADWRRWALAAGTLAAIVAAHGLLGLNTATGGFKVETLAVAFAPLGALGSNLRVAAHDMLALFSADFTTRPIASAVPELLHLPLLALAVAVTGGWLARLARRRSGLGQARLLPLCLALGAATDFAALVFSRRISIESGSIATARYLFGAWVFAAILLARYGAGRVAVRILAAAALGAALVSNWQVLRAPGFPALRTDEFALLTALQNQKVHSGLAGYWQAGLIEVASGGRLHLGACAADPGGHLVPVQRASRTFALEDYTARDFFVVLQQQHAFFSADDVVRSFGRPTLTQSLGGFTILFYPGRAGA